MVTAPFKNNKGQVAFTNNQKLAAFQHACKSNAFAPVSCASARPNAKAPTTNKAGDFF